MAYTPPTVKYKIGDIFSDTLVSKINEILLDIKGIVGNTNSVGHFDIVIVDNQSDETHTFKFKFNFEKYPNGNSNNYKNLSYYKSYREYDYGDGPSLLEVLIGDDFQINADTQIKVWNNSYVLK